MSGFSYDNLSMTKNAIGRSFRWCNGEGTDPRGVAIGKKSPASRPDPIKAVSTFYALCNPFQPPGTSTTIVAENQSSP
jgi:hypothetical protein